MSQRPREILLNRHRDAESKLDAIRSEALASIAGERESASDVGTDRGRDAIPGVSVARLLWDQLVAPCRRVWGGLAVAWAVILVLNVAAVGEEPASRADAGMSADETVHAMRAQRQLLAELSGEGEPAGAEEEPAALRPRGDARREMANA